MSTLAELRDLVEQDLDDAGNALWTTTEIDRAIEKALAEYSRARPLQAEGTVNLAADGREIDVSSLTGLTRVVRVWYPYTSTDPEDPPEWRQWELWQSTLYILDGDEPASGDVVRVYYHTLHTIEDLNSATETTIPAEDEEEVVLGAGGYAAMEKARGAVGEAGASTETPEHWLKWATGRLDAFHAHLANIRRQQLLALDKRVPIHRPGWDRDSVRDGI
jgi:hypothetical protein